MIRTAWSGVNDAWGDAHIRTDDEARDVFSVGIRFWVCNRSRPIDCWGKVIGVFSSVDELWAVVIESVLASSVVTVGSLVVGGVVAVTSSADEITSVFSSTLSPISPVVWLISST